MEKTCENCDKILTLDLFPKDRNVCKKCTAVKAKIARDKRKALPRPPLMICNKCVQELDISLFEKDKKACRLCVLAQRKEASKNGVKIKKVITGVRICNTCNETLDADFFDGGRKMCKKCKRAKNKETEKKFVRDDTLMPTWQVCNKCNIEKEIKSFRPSLRNYRRECRECERIKTKPDSEIKEENKGKFVKCIGCGIEKEVCLENFSINLNTFRTRCKKCVNTTEQWKKYRARKREENSADFTAHNTEMAKKWREENYERFIKTCRIYCNTPNGKTRNMISRAKNDGKIGDCDREELRKKFEEMVQYPCFYCGSKEKLSGIDRVDSRKGYVEDNIVPCCYTCNMMKNTIDIASFIQKARQIAIFNEATSDDPYPFRDPEVLIGGSCSIDRYINRAKLKNFPDFCLGKEEFSDFVNQPCYTCGIISANGIGLYRVDNNIGYTEDNVAPCCSYCNYMKRDFSLDTFLKKCKEISDFELTSKHISFINKSEFNGFLVKKSC